MIAQKMKEIPYFKSIENIKIDNLPYTRYTFAQSLLMSNIKLIGVITISDDKKEILWSFEDEKNGNFQMRYFTIESTPFWFQELLSSIVESIIMDYRLGYPNIKSVTKSKLIHLKHQFD